MEVVEIDIEKLIPYENNPRENKQSVGFVANSLKEFGWRQPIVCDESLTVICGHTRLKAAKELGWNTAPVHIVKDLTPEKIRMYRLADNKAGEGSTWSFPKLDMEFKQLKGLFDFPKFGFDPVSQEGNTEDDAVPEVGESICKLGHLWQLGEHRLLCGDSTKTEDVERLMDGEKADFGFCDPPYNLGFKYNSYDDNKTDEEYKNFSYSWFANLKKYSDRQVITLGTKNIPLMSSMGDVSGVACWIKKNWITSCHIANLQQWEPIFFFGDYTKLKRSSDLYEINRVIQKDVGDNHPCPKQVELIVEIFKSYCIESVLDLFQGSGTSIIACEKTNRRCFGMELDEHYCDVIIKRWEDFTGTEARKI